MVSDAPPHAVGMVRATSRSEEHTSELQSLTNLVCRLLLEKKKDTQLQRRRRQFPSTTAYRTRNFLTSAEQVKEVVVREAVYRRATAGLPRQLPHVHCFRKT